MWGFSRCARCWTELRFAHELQRHWRCDRAFFRFSRVRSFDAEARNSESRRAYPHESESEPRSPTDVPHRQIRLKVSRPRTDTNRKGDPHANCFSDLGLGPFGSHGLRSARVLHDDLLADALRRHPLHHAVPGRFGALVARKRIPGLEAAVSSETVTVEIHLSPRRRVVGFSISEPKGRTHTMTQRVLASIRRDLHIRSGQP